MIRMPNPTALQMMRRKAQAADIKIIENVFNQSKRQFKMEIHFELPYVLRLNLIQELPVPC